MSLSEDQRAMLQLLLEGGEGYEDLAALLGVPKGEVQSRAATALEGLGLRDIDGRNQIVDYLLSQADAEEVAATQVHLTASPTDLTKVRRLHARLRLLYPEAALPVLPTAGKEAPPASAPAATTSSAAPEAVPAPKLSADPIPPADADPPASEPAVPTEPPTPAPLSDNEEAADPSLSTQQKRLLALLAGSGLIIVVAVLALAGVFSNESASVGEGSGETTTTASGETVDETALTRAVLQPQSGNRGAGVAIFGAVDEQTPVLQVTARGLAPTGEGQEYSVWLYQTDEIALRLAGLEVGENGRIATQIELPAEALNFIVDGTLNQVDISRNRKRAYRQEMNASRREQRLPRRIGTSILRGEITGPGLGAVNNQ